MLRHELISCHLTMPKHNSQPDAALYRRAFDGTLYPVDTLQQDLPVLHGTKVSGEFCYLPRGSLAISQNAFYSVSKVLKLTQDPASKAALYRWQARVGFAVAEQIRNEAIAVGKATHTYLHSYLTGKKLDRINPRYELYFQALNQLLPNFGDSLLSEQLIVSFKHRYFGTFDQLGLYRDRLTLSDLKTSSKAKSSLDWVQDKVLQLAAYLIPIETLYPVEQAALIYLIGDGSCNEFVFTPEQMIPFKQLWLERVEQLRNDDHVQHRSLLVS